MILGRFIETPEGCYIGHIRTVFLRSDKVVFEPIPETTNPKAPVFRIYTADEIELGAAWRRATSDGLVYFDVVLDDPTFAQPVRCRLTPARDKPSFLLIWERASRAKASAASGTHAPKGIKEGTRASDALTAA
jgi:uncharacterized protein (DUF736 family)